MLTNGLLRSWRRDDKRIYHYKRYRLAIYNSPTRDIASNLTYRIEYIWPPRGEERITILSKTQDEKISNNMHTKDIAARLAFHKLLSKKAKNSKPAKKE
jgi:hypothetical protein